METTLAKRPTHRLSLFDNFFEPFDRFFNEDYSLAKFNDTFSPLNDIIETDDNYKIDLMLPAFNKDDFNIDIEGNKLTIEGERKMNEETEYKVRQSYFGKFRKTYTLPNNINADKIDGKYENGVLSVTIPKTEKSARKLIKIK